MFCPCYLNNDRAKISIILQTNKHFGHFLGVLPSFFRGFIIFLHHFVRK